MASTLACDANKRDQWQAVHFDVGRRQVDFVAHMDTDMERNIGSGSLVEGQQQAFADQ